MSTDIKGVYKTSAVYLSVARVRFFRDTRFGFHDYRSTRKCNLSINGFKYDLKSNFVEGINFFQIFKNVMNFFCFKEFF